MKNEISKKYIGVYWTEDDRDGGCFTLRIGGTNEFVSKIDPDDPRCSPPGSIETVHNWGNPKALRFDTLDDAIRAGEQAWSADGCHVSVEVISASR